MIDQSSSKHPSSSPSRAMDVDMEGVEIEVSQLAAKGDSEMTTSSSVSKSVFVGDEAMRGDDSDDESAVPGLSDDEGSDAENDDNLKNENRSGETEGNDASISDSPEATATTAQPQEENKLYQSESAASSTTSFHTEPSIIALPGAVYSAVAVSSELHIIPHTSKGFSWNEDLFMKPHQRRNLGVDDMYHSDDSSSSSSDSGMAIHEIRLDEDESSQILPS
ncbi:hypothetical protein EDD11_000914 [Mortierella claussenii]|nr:hypothetical protein EDD11_000914 [Mortierella claussenii]